MNDLALAATKTPLSLDNCMALYYNYFVIIFTVKNWETEDTVDGSHVISLVLALMAALLVIVAGRSCARSAAKANEESHKKAATTQQYHLITENSYTQPRQDLMGSDQDFMGTASAVPQSDDEAATEREYETVTNIFGEVTETIPITSPEEANMPTTTLSVLEEYNKMNGISIEEEPVTQYIEPATKIVIEID